MTAVQALTGSGGWPLSVFLTPGLEPFFGGTYFPPDRRWGRPSFLELLHAVAQAWAERRDEVVQQAGQLAASHGRLVEPLRAPAGSTSSVRAARRSPHLSATHDPRRGGFGGAPKFPTPSRLFFLLRHAAGGDAGARAMLAVTLDAMSAGGMYDWVGGGFHRYSVDDDWLIPHFEKMLYDNALLVRVYGEAALRLGEERWLAVARESADYLLREMQGPEGGFFSSTDADSEGEEGLYFTWTADEVRAALPTDEADAVVRLCALDGPANFEHGRSVLRPRLPMAELAAGLGCGVDEAAARVEHGRRALFEVRRQRVPPLTDDKRLAGWNGMAIWALAWLGAATEERTYVEARAPLRRLRGRRAVPRRRRAGALLAGWRELGRRDARGRRVGRCRPRRAVPGGRRSALARGGVATRRRPAPRATGAMTGHSSTHPTTASGCRCGRATRRTVPPLAGPAVMAGALLRLAALTGRDDLAEAARQAVAAESALLERTPEACTALLARRRRPGRAATRAGRGRRAGVAGDPRPAARLARRAPRPPTVIAPAPAVPVPATVVARVPLFAGRERTDEGRALAYLCEGGACRLPIAEPEALARALSTVQ